MKKLKKGLSLLLVFAMIFSFASTAFAAGTSWTDYSASNQKSDKAYEAVQVMTGLGIVNGVSDDTLNPNGNFTRAQAAKVITYMLLGTEAGEALGDKTIPEANRKFSDYTYNTKWAIPYVEYCASVGIIDGYEDGNFYPNRNVTSTEWLKMLVAALGYDAQKLNGKDWAKHTYDAAIVYNIITAEEFALDFDRETAILYAYNALISEKPDGFNGTSLATSRFKLTDGYTFNNYGAPTAHVFKSNGKEIASIEVKATSTKDNATYTVDTSKADTIYVEDGQKVTTNKQVMGGNSATVSVYEKYDGTHTRVVVVNTLIAEMNKSIVEKFDKVVTAETLKIGDIVIYTQGNSKGDALDGDQTIETAKRVTAVTGTVTDINRNSTDKWVNVDGVKKVTAAKCADDIAALKTNVKYNFYYDDYNNIVKIAAYTEPEREQTLVFLLNSVSTSTYDVSNPWHITTNDTFEAKYIDLSTATVETVDVNTIDKEPGVKVNVDEDKGDLEVYDVDLNTYNRYYWMSENEDGTVDFEAYTQNNVYLTWGGIQIGEADPKVKLTKVLGTGAASQEREYTADSNTNLTVITYTGEFENLKIATSTTGYANFEAATYEAANTFTTALPYNQTTANATDVYVIAPLAAPEKTYAYMMYIGEGVDHAEGGQEYYFVDSFGVKQTLTFDEVNPAVENPSDGVRPALEAGTVYKLTLDKENVFIAAEKLTATKSGTVVKIDPAGYISINNLDNYGVYSAFCGKQAIASDGSVVKLTASGVDAHGCTVTGSTASLYIVDNKVVFITAVKPAAEAES